MIDAIIHALQSVVDLPQPVLAMSAGTLGSWGITQKCKFLIPEDWHAKTREAATQVFAFLTGFWITFAIFPYDNQPAASVAAFIVGLWSPAAWGIAMTLLRMKFPGLADKLSQGTRR